MGVKQPGAVGGDLRVAEEAAVWLQRLRVQDTPEVHAEFSAWVRKGATNLEEFLFAQAVWAEIDQIDASMRGRLWTAEPATSIVAFPEQAPSPVPELPAVGARKRFSGLWGSGVAAAIVLCAVASVYGWMDRDTYVTRVGEQTTVKLPDGSVMYLNTDSRAVVGFTGRERVVRLEAGEALFTVERDVRRSFSVLTETARVRALGTAFNVRSSGGETRVAVVDGAVQVSPLGDTASVAGAGSVSVSAPAAAVRLQAGDEARVKPSRIERVAKPSIERAVSWRVRRLMFPGDPAGEIAAEFNRYNEVPIRIEGEALQTRRMSGVFDADDSSPLVRFLELDPEVEVIRDRGEILIRSRRGGEVR